jgi:DNA repair protein RadC
MEATMVAAKKQYTTRYRLKLVREANVPYAGQACGSPAQVAAILHALLDDVPHEQMVVVYLDSKTACIGCEVIAMGGLCGCSVDARQVFKGALLANAHSVVLGHNHPSSGIPTPSPEDIELTRLVARIGDTLGVPLVDHIITGGPGQHTSLHDLGLVRTARD